MLEARLYTLITILVVALAVSASARKNAELQPYNDADLVRTIAARQQTRKSIVERAAFRSAPAYQLAKRACASGSSPDSNGVCCASSSQLTLSSSYSSCQCCNGQAQTGSIGCCGGQCYTTSSQSCCKNSATMTEQLIAYPNSCCNGVVFSTIGGLQCINNEIINPAITGFCGGLKYTKATQVCCANQISDGKYCCGSVGYDPAKQQVCCTPSGSAPVVGTGNACCYPQYGLPKTYDRDTQVCCYPGDVLTGNSCCYLYSFSSYATGYDSRNSVCCPTYQTSGASRFIGTGDSCCGGGERITGIGGTRIRYSTPYNSKTQVCCAGQVKTGLTC